MQILKNNFANLIECYLKVYSKFGIYNLRYIVIFINYKILNYLLIAPDSNKDHLIDL